MRWFIAFLLVANIILFFWVQQQLQPKPGSVALPAPEVGRLRLLSEVPESQNDASPPTPAPVSEDAGESAPAVQDAAVANGDTDVAMPVQPAADPVAPPIVDPATPRAGTGPVTPPAPMPLDEAVVVAETVPAPPPPAEPVQPPPAETPPPLVPAAEKPAQPQAVCARLGPLEPKDADALLARLPADLELLSDTSEEYARVDSYYVMIPALPSRADGLRKLTELEAAGVTDTWLFRDGEFRNAISLGLFSREDGARRHAARVGRKGFAAEVIERTSQRERRWLLVRHPSGEKLAGVPLLPDGASVTRQDCP